MVIQVTQEYINNGIRRDCSRCPLAFALNEATGYRWDVFDTYARCYNPSYPAFALTQDMLDFRADFDAGCVMQPASLEVPL